MKIRLYVRVGPSPFYNQIHRDYEWPDRLPLPNTEDFVTIGQDEFEVDHLEFHPDRPDWKVSISFKSREAIQSKAWT